MKIKEVYVELGMKASQNFQSSSSTVGLRADLQDGDDAAEVVVKLQKQCYNLLVKKVLPKTEAVAVKPA